ncbi:YfkD family protein [Caldibacillus lycopersici]|uniref:YfkD family protein n=1 Tax=Perspicuibacillus lycopersici TaxID=1325689 RepID=A0AAE3LTU3_9BACI|nr:YfkD famly protein [Perspicuibacillus lycopersici]MCU9614518.1 YfkD family protein [Perspicuibacillus lycopersici]
MTKRARIRFFFIFTLLFAMLFSSEVLAAKTPPKTPPEVAKYQIPDYVLNIAKENTYPNPSQDLPQLQPSELTKELLQTADVKVENPDLILMLNETSINKPILAMGYKATIYLGKWPLNYESKETSPNWEYQKVNTNYYDNRGGNAPFKIHYVQEAQKIVRGGLTAKIPDSNHVKKMMLLKATEKTKLPLSFETIIGAGSKKDQVYNIPNKKLGYLDGYAPAINEKGTVTYGEVYLVLKGGKKSIVVKNVTSQGIGAWIPIQDHISFRFTAVEVPR